MLLLGAVFTSEVRTQVLFFKGVTLPPQAVLNMCLHVQCAKINVLLHSDSGLDFPSEF